jgi:glucose/arabinose dehydrogenase
MPRLPAIVLLLTGLASFPGCGGGGADSALSTGLRLEPVASGLSAPVFMTSPPEDGSRLFIVEQTGAVRIFDVTAGALLARPFLNIASLISGGGERGLLGMAFDPDYATNRRFYVFYTNTPAGDLVVARYLRAAADPDLADPATAFVLQSVPHPGFSNHNGGMLAFGPDGCLYVAAGDGGGAGDPGNNAQNANSGLGKILRLDGDTGAPCTKGVTNPFASGGGAAQVWSLGLRNPWRFSFDRQTGDLYIADVGQNTREEINVATGTNPGRGTNFGWRLMEGFLCFNTLSNCDPGGLTLPAIDYPHTGGACSVTGGYVYRGAAIASLQGTYFYADFCAGFVRTFRFSNGLVLDPAEWPRLSPTGGRVTSFGEDSAGELYLMNQGGGLWKIVAD